MKFPNKEKYVIGNGVYCITNTQTKKMYIGSAFRKNNKGIVARYNEYAFQEKTYYNAKLQNAILKYGLDKFVFDVLEIIDTNVLECRTKEEYYIKRFNTIEKGYNIKAQATGGNGGANLGKKYPQPSKEIIKLRGEGVSRAMKGKKKNPEHCLAISQARKGPEYWGNKQVFLKNKHTQEIISFNSRINAAKYVNCSIDSLWRLLTGKTPVLLKTYVKCTKQEIDMWKQKSLQ